MNYGDYDLRPPGGSLPVPGRPAGTDTQPAWLTPGEFVVPRDSAEANKELLEDIRSSHGPLRSLPKMSEVGMAGGGFVSAGGVQYLAKGGEVRGFGSGIKRLLGRGEKGRHARKTAKAAASRILHGKRAAPRHLASNLKLDQAGPPTTGGGHGASASAGAVSGLGEAFGKASEIAEKIPGPWGRVIEYTTKFAEVLLKSVDILKNWSEDLHKFNMQFAEFSGAMSGVQARQEVRDIQLSIERGQRTAASAEYLAEGKSELARSTARFEDSWQRIKNDVGGLLDRVMAGTVGRVLDNIARLVEPILNLIEGDQGPSGAGFYASMQWNAKEYERKYGRPSRLNGGGP